MTGKKCEIKKKKKKKEKAKSAQRRTIKNRIKTKRGVGIIDKIIDKIPCEMHVPGYQFCGPGNIPLHSIIHIDFFFF